MARRQCATASPCGLAAPGFAGAPCGAPPSWAFSFTTHLPDFCSSVYRIWSPELGSAPLARKETVASASLPLNAIETTSTSIDATFTLPET